jgi:hypothetical protein
MYIAVGGIEQWVQFADDSAAKPVLLYFTVAPADHPALVPRRGSRGNDISGSFIGTSVERV